LTLFIDHKTTAKISAIWQFYCKKRLFFATNIDNKKIMLQKFNDYLG